MFDPPLSQISKDVRKDVDKQLEHMFRAVALQVFAKIVVRTPVDTGNARGGWQASIFRPNLSNQPPSKANTITRLPQNPSLLPYWLSNPLPYIEVLEFGGYGPGGTAKTGGTGFSLQAPRGMIRVTLSEFKL